MIVSRIYLLTHSFIHSLALPFAYRLPPCIHFQSSVKIQSQMPTAPAHTRNTHTHTDNEIESVKKTERMKKNFFFASFKYKEMEMKNGNN